MFLLQPEIKNTEKAVLQKKSLMWSKIVSLSQQFVTIR